MMWIDEEGLFVNNESHYDRHCGTMEVNMGI